MISKKRTSKAAATGQQMEALSTVQPLVDTMLHGKSDAKRVAACNEILDRGYGTPTGGARVNKPPASSDAQAEFRFYARLAIETLKVIAERSLSGRARVLAAKSILDRACGEAGVEGLSPIPKGQPH
jgi:hypothetical protein